MADVATEPIVIETPIVETQVPYTESEEFKRQIAFAYGEKIEEVAPPVVEAPATTETTEAPVFNYADFFKEKGFETPEALQSEWETLQTLKTTPPQTKAEIEFANEESKKIHDLLREGKTAEVRKYLDAQETLANVETMATEQKLKLYIKLQNPKFDEELVEDEYRTLYQIDEDDFIGDELKLRKEKARLEQRLENDSDKAMEFFEQYRKKIELPDITAPQAAIDEDYESWKASMQTSTETITNVIIPAIEAVKENDLVRAIKVSDANNQMDFDVKITPDKEDFSTAQLTAKNVIDFLKDLTYNDKGDVTPKELIDMVLWYKNKDKYVQSAARQAVNAERLRVVSTDTEGGIGGKSNAPLPEKSELQKHMDAAFAGVTVKGVMQ